MLNKIIPMTGLTLFFLILAERITFEAIIIGGCLSWLVLHAQRAGRSKEPDTGKPIYMPVLWLLWIKLIAVLTREIVLSNVQVAKIVLSPKMLIDPKVHHYVTRLKDERLIVVLSNAITLTPGTMTVDVIQNRLTIHALSDVYFEALSGNPVEKILLEMEARIHG